METALLHCHLFKNAGTSLDHILRENFGNALVSKEFSGPLKQRQFLIADWLNTNSRAKAFSSHTILGPIHDQVRREVLLIANVRHPIDRIYSAYKFEKLQATPNFGAVLASETSFRGYVRSRMALANISPHYFCVNWQARYFAGFANVTSIEKNIADAELFDLALNGLDKFFHIGVVDELGASNYLLEKKLQPIFGDFKLVEAHLNKTTDKSGSLEGRLAEIESELGSEVYVELTKANKVDIWLHTKLATIYKN